MEMTKTPEVMEKPVEVDQTKQKQRQRKRLKNFWLTDEQEHMLEVVAKHMGTSESEALRNLILIAYLEVSGSSLVSKKIITQGEASQEENPQESNQKQRQRKRLKNFRLTDEQERMLEEIANYMGTSESEALRNLVLNAYMAVMGSPLAPSKKIESQGETSQESNTQ